MNNCMKKINLNNVINILFIISCPFLTILLSNRYRTKVTIIGALLSFIIAIIIEKNFLKKIEYNSKKLLVSFIISIYSLKYYIGFENKCIYYISILLKRYIKFDDYELLYIIFLTMALVSFSVFIYLIVDKIIPIIINFTKKLSKVEKKYLVIISIIGLIVSVILPRITTAFSLPYNKNELRIYDVIYTSDSGALTYGDTYFNVSYVENDIRQPLFGIFALPISIVAKMLSEFLYISPDNYRYAAAMTFLQFILLAYSIILISKMLKLRDREKKYFYLLISCTFPYLIFSILLEQYVISLFYLIVTCYLYYQNKIKINYLYIGAVGTMITSGVIFPLISKKNNLKRKINDIFNCFLVFVATFIVGGQFPQIFDIKSNILRLMSGFAKKLTLAEKFEQYTGFIKSIFIAPKGYYTHIYDHIAYHQIPIKHIDLFGVLLFFIAILGFVTNRKNKFARFCLLWILFSIIVLIIVGWGTTENGLILYSLYFGFAYVSLIFMFMKQVIKNKRIFRTIIYVLCIIIMMLNVSELINIFKFAIKYYGL